MKEKVLKVFDYFLENIDKLSDDAVWYFADETQERCAIYIEPGKDFYIKKIGLE